MMKNLTELLNIFNPNETQSPKSSGTNLSLFLCTLNFCFNNCIIRTFLRAFCYIATEVFHACGKLNTE